MSDAHPLLIIMGVSGCGKTSVGTRLAERLDWPFQEGDELHPAANIAKMVAGSPLDDADRWPWLEAIARWLDQRRRGSQPGIVACSALKRKYRDFLRRGRPEVCFVYLRVGRAELRRRLQQRRDHYMPTSLLDSQLATLEVPDNDEPVLVLDAEGDIDSIVEALRARLVFWPHGG